MKLNETKCGGEALVVGEKSGSGVVVSRDGPVPRDLVDVSVGKVCGESLRLPSFNGVEKVCAPNELWSIPGMSIDCMQAYYDAVTSFCDYKRELMQSEASSAGVDRACVTVDGCVAPAPSEVSPGSSVSSASAKRRARRRAAARAAGCGGYDGEALNKEELVEPCVTDVLGTGLGSGGGSFAGQDEGYCYLLMIRPECRHAVANVLGPDPSFGSILALSEEVVDFGAARGLRVSKVAEGAYHLGEKGVPFLECMSAVMVKSSSERKVGFLSGVIKVGSVFGSVVDMAPALTSVLGGKAGAAARSKSSTRVPKKVVEAEGDSPTYVRIEPGKESDDVNGWLILAAYEEEVSALRSRYPGETIQLLSGFDKEFVGNVRLYRFDQGYGMDDQMGKEYNLDVNLMRLEASRMTSFEYVSVNWHDAVCRWVYTKSGGVGSPDGGGMSFDKAMVIPGRPLGTARPAMSAGFEKLFGQEFFRIDPFAGQGNTVTVSYPSFSFKTLYVWLPFGVAAWVGDEWYAGSGWLKLGVMPVTISRMPYGWPDFPVGDQPGVCCSFGALTPAYYLQFVWV